jgi:hypothetical protein
MTAPLCALIGKLDAFDIRYFVRLYKSLPTCYARAVNAWIAADYTDSRVYSLGLAAYF